MTLQSFINETGIVLTAQPTDHNPHMTSSDAMDHWKVKLVGKRLGNATMRLYFSMGAGHNGAAPTVENVLDCLASDASGFDNSTSFEDWCAEYGYSEDSRTALKTFKTVERQAGRLRRFLGEEYFNVLLNAERL